MYVTYTCRIKLQIEMDVIREPYTTAQIDRVRQFFFSIYISPWFDTASVKCFEDEFENIIVHHQTTCSAAADDDNDDDDYAEKGFE